MSLTACVVEGGAKQPGAHLGSKWIALGGRGKHLGGVDYWMDACMQAFVRGKVLSAGAPRHPCPCAFCFAQLESSPYIQTVPCVSSRDELRTKKDCPATLLYTASVCTPTVN